MLRDDPHGPAVLGHPRSMPPMPPPALERPARGPGAALEPLRRSPPRARRGPHPPAPRSGLRGSGPAGSASPPTQHPGHGERDRPPHLGSLPRCGAVQPPPRRAPSAPAEAAPAGVPCVCPPTRTPANLSRVCRVSPPATLPPADRTPAALGATFAPLARGGTGLRGEWSGGCLSAVPHGCAAAEPPAPLFPARCCRTLNYTPSISRI